MWTVVHIAPNKKEAQRMLQYLTNEGFLVKVRPITLHADGDNTPVEILVPESEVEEALEMISQY
ncbi:MAG: glutamate decarboxylase [Desulfurispora sp.]|uniref:glutamate decarboxylase n=1 Tax=Desulfurispora sp. TaxID=3014275 RepID=UPI004049892D